jgi:hypothetical protein
VLKSQRIAALADTDDGDAMNFELAIRVTHMLGDMEARGQVRAALELLEADIHIGRFQCRLLALSQCEMLKPLNMPQQAHAQYIFRW